MEHIILLRKYQYSIQQLQAMSDAVFQLRAELEAANERIAELEKEQTGKKDVDVN
jgi:hypothetical protein